MKLSSWMLLAPLALAACGVLPVSAMETVALDQDFVLKVGQAVSLAQSNVRVGLDSVADSRCPKGEQCVRAGEARARIWLQAGSGPRQALELVQSAVSQTQGQGQANQALGLRVLFIRLDPSPVSGRTVAASDYRLTLKLQRADAVDAVDVAR